jgi:hypothetical protein
MRHTCNTVLHWVVIIILWSINPLLGNDSVNTLERTCNNTGAVFLMWVCANPFLGNDSVNTHTPNSIQYPLLGYQCVFCWSDPSLYNQTPRPATVQTTVTMRVVGGDEKGSLKSETVKYGCESKGTRTQERLRWQGPAAYKKSNPLVREGVPQKPDHNCRAVINIWSWAPDGAWHQDLLIDWLSDRPTVSHNVTLTLLQFSWVKWHELVVGWRLPREEWFVSLWRLSVWYEDFMCAVVQ